MCVVHTVTWRFMECSLNVHGMFMECISIERNENAICCGQIRKIYCV